MPRLRVRIPVEVPVTEDELELLGKLGTVVKVARESGLLGAVRDFVTTAQAQKRRARPRRKPSR